MERAGLINVYVCEASGHRTMTVNAVDGTTPFMIRCRTPGCESMARSSFYRVDQGLAPTHEWYRPDPAERGRLDEETQEYVDRGCLLIRKLDAVGRERYGVRLRRG